MDTVEVPQAEYCSVTLDSVSIGRGGRTMAQLADTVHAAHFSGSS